MERLCAERQSRFGSDERVSLFALCAGVDAHAQSNKGIHITRRFDKDMNRTSAKM
jgi:hypothetical protein